MEMDHKEVEYPASHEEQQAVMEKVFAKKLRVVLLDAFGKDRREILMQANSDDPARYTRKELFTITAYSSWVHYIMAQAGVPLLDLYVMEGKPEYVRQHGIRFQFQSREERLGLSFQLASTSDLWQKHSWETCLWEWSWEGLRFSEEEGHLHTLTVTQEQGPLEKLIQEAQAFVL